jgi:hypothetical protein
VALLPVQGANAYDEWQKTIEMGLRCLALIILSIYPTEYRSNAFRLLVDHNRRRRAITKPTATMFPLRLREALDEESLDPPFPPKGLLSPPAEVVAVAAEDESSVVEEVELVLPAAIVDVAMVL